MDWKARFVDETAAVAKAFRRATYQALQRLGFMIRGQAQSSIQEETGPSAPGSPPHTHKHAVTKKGKPRKQGLLPSSILYALDKDSMSVIVGPSVNVVDTVGAAFEHEGESSFRGQDYPSRSFMGPALGEEIGALPGLLAEQYGKV